MANCNKLIVSSVALFLGLSNGIGSPIAYGAQNECDRILDSQSIRDGELYYFNSGKVIKLKQGEFPSKIERDAKLWYVVNTGIKQSGVLVVKTGRYSENSSDKLKYVEMFRKDLKPQDDKKSFVECDAKWKAEVNGSVSAVSYDEFHDRGESALVRGDLKKILEFHVLFASKTRGGKATCVDTKKTGFSLNGPRKDFSFNSKVVASGLTARLPSLSKALAEGTKGLADARTMLLPYSGFGGYVCVGIKIPRVSEIDFIRIADSERSKLSSAAREVTWEKRK